MTNQPEPAPAQEPEQEQQDAPPATEAQPAQEEPQADALASEQEQQEAEQEKAQEPEAQPDPKAQKLAAEAKRYRLALRETETQLEAERARSNRLENALIDQLADMAGVEHLDTLRALGLTLADITAPDGNLLPPEKAATAISKFAEKYGVKTVQRYDKPDPSQSAGTWTDSNDWNSSFKIR